MACPLCVAISGAASNPEELRKLQWIPVIALTAKASDEVPALPNGLSLALHERRAVLWYHANQPHRGSPRYVEPLPGGCLVRHSKQGVVLLFNSYPFILLFLPVTLFGFFLLARRGHRLAAAWLAAASIFFYGFWNPVYVVLLLASIGSNYAFGARLASLHASGREAQAGRLLAVAVAGNLLLLGYYKYANFFLENLGKLTGAPRDLAEIVLPLGISFFTFTQIAFLVDARRGKAKEYSFIHYCLFVTYFPHLIAGPILHHGEMMPQFRKEETYRVKWENLAVGLTLFLIGLYKKTVLADGIAEFVGPTFDAAAAGTALTSYNAWGAALAYAFQIYFDFSGYSDMAIGLSRLFGIVLPLNFDSPYKAASIMDFWRRWHITLSRFLRDYLYIPLGGNRRGTVRRYLNLFLTMLLGGFWHGAGWTYICWGMVHGTCLMLNRGWMSLCQAVRFEPQNMPGWAALARLLTFTTVVVAWVFFRASNMDAALAMLKAMAGMGAPDVPGCTLISCLDGGAIQVAWIAALLVVVWTFPNTQEILANVRPGLVSPGYREILPQQPARRWMWRPSLAWLVAVAGVGIYAVLSISEFSEFIYFAF
jgi:D-alanyl-lipoteichoic acid acyltransferase DltB (MBOAT superfamily)